MADDIFQEILKTPEGAMGFYKEIKAGFEDDHNKGLYREGLKIVLKYQKNQQIRSVIEKELTNLENQ